MRLRRYVPAVADVLDEIGAAARQTGGRMTPEVERVMHAVWPRLQESVTIDTGVMERAQHIAVIPISVGWNDIGSWMQVATLFTHDEFGNAAVGLAPDRHVEINTTDTLLYSTTGRMIATAGVEGLVVVDTGDHLLICSKEHAQLVKEIAEHLRRQQPARSEALLSPLSHSSAHGGVSRSPLAPRPVARWSRTAARDPVPFATVVLYCPQLNMYPQNTCRKRPTSSFLFTHSHLWRGHAASRVA